MVNSEWDEFVYWYGVQFTGTMRQLYLVITNISKRPNIIKLIHVATAYACTGILMVGQRTFDCDRDLPPYLHHPPIHRFRYWHECVIYLTDHSIRLIGIEIHPDAQPIEAFLTTGQDDDAAALALVMGNEGTGLQDKQVQSCQGFCRIPQYGSGTASLNVYVAASIVLYRLQHATMPSVSTTNSDEEQEATLCLHGP